MMPLWTDGLNLYRNTVGTASLHSQNANLTTRIVLWDPEAGDRLRLLQSAFVNSQYHELRIIIHRP